MAKRPSDILKKYLYLSKEFIKGSCIWLSRTLRVIGFDYTNLLQKKDVHLSREIPFPTDWQKVYPHKKLVVEIGFGHGEVADSISSSEENTLYVGFEWAKLFFKKLHRKIGAHANVWLLYDDAYRYFRYLFKPNSIDSLLILFPDPWHKKRHHKRRPITSEFLYSAVQKLRVHGTILIATDWLEYFEFIESQCEKLLDRLGENADSIEIEYGDYSPEKFDLPKTHYFKKWVKEGRQFRFVRVKRNG